MHSVSMLAWWEVRQQNSKITSCHSPLLRGWFVVAETRAVAALDPVDPVDLPEANDDDMGAAAEPSRTDPRGILPAAPRVGSKLVLVLDELIEQPYVSTPKAPPPPHHRPPPPPPAPNPSTRNAENMCVVVKRERAHKKGKANGGGVRMHDEWGERRQWAYLCA